MNHVKLVPMRSRQCALCRAVALAPLEEGLGQPVGVFGTTRRVSQGGAGKGLGGHLREPNGQGFYQVRAPSYQRGAVFDHLGLDSVEPGTFGLALVRKQAIAFTQCGFVARGMGGVHRI